MKNKLSVTPANFAPIPYQGNFWAVKSAHGTKLWWYLVISEKFKMLFFAFLGSWTTLKTSGIYYAPVFIFENRTWTAELFQSCRRWTKKTWTTTFNMKSLEYLKLSVTR